HLSRPHLITSDSICLTLSALFTPMPPIPPPPHFPASPTLPPCSRPSHPDNARQKAHHQMFSHVVIFWTDPNLPGAADELIAAANECLIRILHTRLNPFINTGALAPCNGEPSTGELLQ